MSEIYIFLECAAQTLEMAVLTRRKAGAAWRTPFDEIQSGLTDLIIATRSSSDKPFQREQYMSKPDGVDSRWFVAAWRRLTQKSGCGNSSRDS